MLNFFQHTPQSGNIEEICSYAIGVCDASSFPPDTVEMAVNFASREASIHCPDNDGYNDFDREMYRNAAFYRMIERMKNGQE